MNSGGRARRDEHFFRLSTAIAERGRTRQGHQGMPVLFLAWLAHHGADDRFGLGQTSAALQLDAAPLAINKLIGAWALVRGKDLRFALWPTISWH